MVRIHKLSIDCPSSFSQSYGFAKVDPVRELEIEKKRKEKVRKRKVASVQIVEKIEEKKSESLAQNSKTATIETSFGEIVIE